METLQAQILFASMLIKLGLTTYEEIKELFRGEGHDDERLAAILSEVNARIARRS